MQINVLEAKNRLSELVKAAEDGEEVIIARRGQPAVRLVPMRMTTPDEPGSGRAIAEWLARHPLHGPARSTLEIEADIAAERVAWE